jgi:NTP pyrophosphatase (non-canonical NTP hydrolase)
MSYQDALNKHYILEDEMKFMGVQGDYGFHHQAKFMNACGQSTKHFNMLQLQLYTKLVLEETKELVEAMEKILAGIKEGKPIHQADVAEVLDAAGDIIVVAGGVAYSAGIDPQEILKRVWATNLAKLGPNGECIRREDGKILKPAGWEPPQFGDLAYKALNPIAAQEGAF